MTAIPPERMQMVLMACANKRFVVQAALDEYAKSKNYIQTSPAGGNAGVYDVIEKVHLHETQTFSPTGMFDEKTSKELYFPILNNAYKNWFDESYKNKYKTNLLDSSGIDGAEYAIDKYFNFLDPQGKPATYFNDYQLCVFDDREDVSLTYAYNVNNFANDPNTRIRLNNLEIVNQAKDQFTAQIDFKVKMEFNFRSLEDIQSKSLSFGLNLTEDSLKSFKKVNEDILSEDQQPRFYSLKDFFPDDDGQVVQKVGLKIRTYLNAEYYKNLGKLLGTPVSFITPSSALFNQKDKLSNREYKAKTENYYYVDRIYRIKPVKHLIRFYENMDSNGNAMDLPHKLIIDFGAYISTTNEESITIYSELISDYVGDLNSIIKTYNDSIKTITQVCNGSSTNDFEVEDTFGNKKSTEELQQYALEKVKDLNDIFQTAKTNLITNLNSVMINKIISSLKIYSLEVPERIFNVYEENASLHQVLEAASAGANIGMMGGMLFGPQGSFVGALAGGFGAGIYTSIFTKNPDIKDLSWASLNTSLNLLSPTDLSVLETYPGIIGIKSYELDTRPKQNTKNTAEDFLRVALKITNRETQGFDGSFASAQVAEANKKVDDARADIAKSNIKDANEIQKGYLEELKKATQTETTGELTKNLGVQYFYLGNLLDYILSIYNKNTRANNNLFVSGNYIFKDVLEAVAYLLNLGNIPISLNLFIKFLEDNLAGRNSYKYDCITFIRDIINNLIKISMERAWTGEAVLSKEKSKELKKFVPTNTYLAKKRIYGDKKTLLQQLKLTNDDSYIFYKDVSDLQNKSNIILNASFTTKDIKSYDMIYISCKSEHTYMDFYEDYNETKLVERGHGYNSLAFMEQVIENFQIPCVLLSKTNAIPQIIASNAVKLERIDDSNLMTANAIAGKNLIENYPYQGTLELHSMFFNFIDVTNYLFISPGIWNRADNEYSGLYTVLRSTYTKKFDQSNSPAEYKVEVRWESNGRGKVGYDPIKKDSKTAKNKNPSCEDLIKGISLVPAEETPSKK